ncbi:MULTISPECIES: sigma-70 family RNA polymerase sigma factor [Mycolicibacterium]|uniref:RNA polymerase sigma factor n=1 Tax=Mycolicibacterium chitae TaxID=1792 RepID=A0A448I548_MYCCI|nr:sigma-70 family RNA polymerase sigma factor [Mycolicibacterium chitae]VEG47608.1 RNA polymerase sigma factor, sigma-70 family [Mycolicibacterium chitae]
MRESTVTAAAGRFEAEVLPYRDALLRAARRLTRTEADAEDLLQDTLLRAYAGFEGFQTGTNLNAWLFRILHNQWVSAFRHRQRRPAEVSFDALTEHDLARAAAARPAAARSAEAAVLAALPGPELEAALGALSEDFRTAVYYAEVAGYTYLEVAALMGTPVGTAMSRVSRARQRLREQLTAA